MSNVINFVKYQKARNLSYLNKILYKIEASGNLTKDQMFMVENCKNLIAIKKEELKEIENVEF